MAENPLADLVKQINRAYSHAVYSATRAILSPVTDALADEIRESVSNAVREGISDALNPADIFGSLFRKKQ